MIKFKNQLIINLIIVSILFCGCAKLSDPIDINQKANWLIGNWNGCDNGNEPISLMVKDENSIYFFDQRKSSLQEVLPPKRNLNLEVNRSVYPMQFDIQIESINSSEDNQVKMIFKFLAEDEISLKSFYDHRRPKSFTSNHAFTIVLKKEIFENPLKPFGHFDPVVIQEETGLMWAKNDSPTDINLIEAKEYCRNFRAGGFDDWRLPTLDEISGLMSSGLLNYKNNGDIMVHRRLWSSDFICNKSSIYSQGSFSIKSMVHYISPNTKLNLRVLPVRDY